MANSDVRSAMDTLDTAIQALDTSALLAAEFTPGAESTGPGFVFRVGRLIDDLKVHSTATVAELESLRELEGR